MPQKGMNYMYTRTTKVLSRIRCIGRRCIYERPHIILVHVNVSVYDGDFTR
jgi:hypothetical protein